MQTFSCQCGNRLYFENTKCVECDAQVGWCPQCRRVTALVPTHIPQQVTCGNDDCRSALTLCRNYSVERICNCCVRAGAETMVEATPPICEACQLTDVIPDLSVPDNRDKWYRLEAAKRRLIYQLDRLDLPYRPTDAVMPRLSFDFKADLPSDAHWRASEGGRVYTGHANGKITINIAEADDAEREKLRIEFGEDHRTLIGHFRHEIGHYYWQVLVEGEREDHFRDVFGDHRQPEYAESKRRFYETGPAADWTVKHVSAYASMHPWEDFAETFALYLEIRSVSDTAQHLKMVPSTPPSIDELISQYQRLGLMVNELNRSLGLLDLVPRPVIPAVRPKLQFIHDLCRDAGLQTSRD